MTEIRLTNGKTRRKEVFTPIDPKNVRMYVCGPTVYDRAHVGNARPVVVFDTLFRLLRHVYGADHVTYVRNFTDVDDKINATALARQQAGDARPLEVLIHERTEETIRWYHDDMDALGALRPTHEPRATAYIPQMIAMIETLVLRKNAYVVRDQSNYPPKDFVIFDNESHGAGHALFDVESYSDYGSLSGRSIEDMIAGARVEVAPYKKNPSDFVLWKPSSDNEPGWESPWGRGRPGWHIECSAMSQSLLGDSFDIHGGGLDLQFPHHENEIAQSCCALATPEDPLGRQKFARYWMHNEMLQVEGKKMSKSLGNFFTVRDLLENGHEGIVIRYVMLSTHYRKTMDWTAEKADRAMMKLHYFHNLLNLYAPDLVPDEKLVGVDIIESLANDLNSHEALVHLDKLANVADDPESEFQRLAARDLGHALKFLGLYSSEIATGRHEWLPPNLDEFVEKLTALRYSAQTTKDFSQVDALKSALVNAGIDVRMSKLSIELVPLSNFDPSKLEALK